jgi:hypothetical protein
MVLHTCGLPWQSIHDSLLSIDPPTIIQKRLAMARGHAYSSSLRRLFHPSSRSVDDELVDLEESFRNSSFALVPSALTPSRAPSNSVIGATRALFLNRPVPLDFPSGWEKGPVTDWYNKQRAKGSTTIKKIQLRRDYQHPYYHEYIIISTRSDHAYRIDRRPDPDAPFDTIMKMGCTAHDTIQEVDSTSLKELDSTSSCVVELHWENEESVDLLFVLSICFAIHNDKQAGRYTLQRYNCYFVSWAVIAITMRKSAVCEGVFNVWVWEMERQEWDLEEEVPWERGLEWQSEGQCEWGRIAWEQEQGLGLGRELGWTLVRELRQQLGLGRVWGWELERELERELGQRQVVVWEEAREWAREWAHDFGKIPLLLGSRKNPLVKTVSSRQVVS